VGKKNLDDFNIGLVSKKDIFCDAVFNQCATEREEEYKEYKEYKEEEILSTAALFRVYVIKTVNNMSVELLNVVETSRL
jgi:hypothetical protein